MNGHFSVNGEKDYLSCHEFNREEVLKWLSYMTTRSGIPVMRFRKYQHTDYPSIQGVWTPFTHQAPELNVAQFPHVT
jgi:large subunit ribosomal protein L43